jgi:hypothetical protein
VAAPRETLVIDVDEACPPPIPLPVRRGEQLSLFAGR